MLKIQVESVCENYILNVVRRKSRIFFLSKISPELKKVLFAVRQTVNEVFIEKLLALITHISQTAELIASQNASHYIM